MIRLNVKVVEIHHASKDKKHDFDLIVEDLNMSNSQIWVQVRRTQAELIRDVKVGNNYTIKCHGEYAEQTSGKGKAYRHNNLILRDIRRISVDNQFEGYSDDALVHEVNRRKLNNRLNPIIRDVHHNNPANFRGDFEKNPVENPETINLFVSHANLLTWDQWNFIFKDVARKGFEERRKMKRDLSLVLNETIS